ncbi:MAG: protein phosphatase 2C domain-containing protein [Sphingomonas sp.]|uniref:protein phosphatase 2C domain-containing protein n=1 Tax=Sphingomonas sp. TaxID=28214 RepID=UPI001B28B8AC|nr:protein phosphatase 2C domain-containing protein [Sphingomonas sp.]MBO9621598.1 protein phosphatase 2C domain-containing protein [Sphingomonas sp.]
MRFDLIQSLSLAGSSGIPNDDRTGSRDRLAWVIDGATDLGPPGLVGPRGGAAWLADQANAELACAADAPVEAMLQMLALRIADCFVAARARAPLGRWELPIAALLVARLDEDALECGWLGDCAGLLRRTDGSVIRLGRPPVERDRETQLARDFADYGLGTIKGRDDPLIETLRASRERPGLLQVLGVEGSTERADTQRVPCAPGDELLLMTDGFAALVDSYGAYDAAALMDALPRQGLAPLATALRKIENADDTCTRFPRFKISDDATALWLRIA